MLIVLSLLQNMMVCVMDISSLFQRFSHCQDRALERDRPQQREKKCVMDISNAFLQVCQRELGS